MQIEKKSTLPGPGAYSTPLDVPILGLKSVNRRYSKKGAKEAAPPVSELGLRTRKDSLYDDSSSIIVGGSKMRNNMGLNRLNANSTICSSNIAMSKIGVSLASTIRCDLGKSFGKAHDRFITPTLKHRSPSPNAYQIPDTTLGQMVPKKGDFSNILQ